MSKLKKPSTEPRRGCRIRTISASEAPEHIEKLKYTLKTFPKKDLAARNDFIEVEGKINIAGRTYKKPVFFGDPPQKYLLKKNAREAMRDDGSKTLSREMNLSENHEESFREICALRLFEFIWGEKGVTPEDVKIVLSEFDLGKMQNYAKENMTKVYFASRQVDGLSFDVARLSVENEKILSKKNEDGSFENQHLIDQLCEQIIIQCILSNPDAIKFDNFFVDAKKNLITHFDFGDARNNEYSSPDPLCILDSIRRHVDGNSTKSIRATFAGDNIVYGQAINFFQKHISPNHLLNVIDKLEKIPEKDLWDMAYIYTYGNELGKKTYADCFIARIRSVTFLKDLLERILADDSKLEEFSSKSIRKMLTKDAIYQESKAKSELYEEVNNIFANLAEIIEIVYGDSKEEMTPESSNESLDEESEDEKVDKLDVMESKSDSAKSESKSDSANEENEVDESVDSTEEDGSELSESEEENSASASESEDASSFDEAAAESENDNLSESKEDKLWQSIKESRNTIHRVCDEMMTGLSTIIDREEKLPDGVGHKTIMEISKNEVFNLKNKLNDFYGAVKFELSKEEGFVGKKDFCKYAEEKKDEISNCALSFLTHCDSYQELQRVKECGYSYDQQQERDSFEYVKLSEGLASNLQRIFGSIQR